VIFCLVLLLPGDLFHTKTHDHEQWCHQYKERTCSESPMRSFRYSLPELPRESMAVNASSSGKLTVTSSKRHILL
jgi:hypothetical protein